MRDFRGLIKIAGLEKTASKVEQNLIKVFLKKGKTVPISVASKITGISYPKKYKTLNDFVSTRNGFFNKHVVPLMNEHRRIVSTAAPISDVIPDGTPVFRGVTRFRGGKPNYVNGVLIRSGPGVALPYAYNSSIDKLLDRLSARRFFSGDLKTAKLYAEGVNGTRWLRIGDLSTPVGKWALKNEIVVPTPRIDYPSHTYRKAVRRLIDQGKIIPERDLIPIQIGFRMDPSNFRIDSEMGIPAYLRPFLKERSYKLVAKERGGRRDFVLTRSQGKRLDDIEKMLDKLTLGNGPRQDYNFNRFVGYNS